MYILVTSNSIHTILQNAVCQVCDLTEPAQEATKSLPRPLILHTDKGGHRPSLPCLMCSCALASVVGRYRILPVKRQKEKKLKKKPSRMLSAHAPASTHTKLVQVLGWTYYPTRWCGLPSGKHVYRPCGGGARARCGRRVAGGVSFFFSGCKKMVTCTSKQRKSKNAWRGWTAFEKLVAPGIEPGTFCTSNRRDNRYTTNSNRVTGVKSSETSCHVAKKFGI